LHEVQVGRLQRGGALRHHGELGQRAISKVEEAGEDRITRLEAGHAAADLDHHTGEITSQSGGQLKVQDGFESSLRNHVVDRIQPRSVDLNQKFIELWCGAGNIGKPDLGRLAIAFEGECFHVFFLSRVRAGAACERCPSRY
jgi:hypothetical protein